MVTYRCNVDLGWTLFDLGSERGSSFIKRSATVAKKAICSRLTHSVRKRRGNELERREEKRKKMDSGKKVKIYQPPSHAASWRS